MEKKMLERLGYKVTVQMDSVKALEVFQNNPDFDLVVTDFAMPNMPGDKFASKLLEIKPDTPIILCTGFSEKMTPDLAKEIGIKGILLKPIIKKDLAKKIREALDS
ncbi:MAG: response regulator [Desulfobacteraceae bacterium]|nr:response regulator [Desulfobacteraceae bacterium]